MGQAVSRRLVPRLERMRAKYDDLVAREAIAEVERRRTEAVAGRSKQGGLGGQKGQDKGEEMPSVSSTLYTDPNARLTGFTRGAQYQDFLDERRRSQLEQEVGGGGGDPEMPPDLVDFLSDAGPLEKSVNEGLTSDRFTEENRRQKESGSDPDHPDDSSTKAGDSAGRRAGPRRRGDGGDDEWEARSSAVSTKEALPGRRADAEGRGDDSPSSERLTDAEITDLLLDHQHRAGAGMAGAAPMLELIVNHVGVPTVALRDRHATSEEEQDDSEDTPYVALWPGDGGLGRYGRVVYPPPRPAAADVGDGEKGPAGAAAALGDDGDGKEGGDAEKEEVEVGELVEAVAASKGKRGNVVLDAVRRRAATDVAEDEKR